MKDLAAVSVDIDSITQDPKNARLHSTKQLEYIAASLERFGQQKCVQCEIDKHIDDFEWTSSKRTGRRKICRGCRKQYKLSLYHSNKEQTNAERKQKYRLNPDNYKNKALASYYKRRESVLIYKKQYRLSNPNKYKVWNQKRRALLANAEGSFTTQDIDNLFITQNGLCEYCKCDIANCYQLDHIIPLSKGGSNNIENLCLACKPCNSSKWNRTLEEWQAFKERLNG